MFYAVLISLVSLTIMLLLVFIRVNKLKYNDTSNKINNKTTQKMLPFKDISNNVIDLGDYNYRAIIEVTSINYDLKTDEEKDIIEINYNRFINSLTHPISIFILTKQIDQSKILDEIKRDYENMKKNYPSGYENVIDMIGKYYSSMNNIHKYTNNNLIKKKYIIVPYNDIQNLANLSNLEKKEESIKQLMNRCNVIINGINGISSITAKILNTEDILELLYSYYHREEALREEALKNSEFTTMIVNNPNLKCNNVDSDILLDAILCEAQYKLKNELINIKKGTKSNVQNVNIALRTINNLRIKLNEINRGGK